MALIKCPECEGMISEKASACPHCGCPLNTVVKKLGAIKDSVSSGVASAAKSTVNSTLKHSAFWKHAEYDAFSDGEQFKVYRAIDGERFEGMPPCYICKFQNNVFMAERPDGVFFKTKDKRTFFFSMGDISRTGVTHSWFFNSVEFYFGLKNGDEISFLMRPAPAGRFMATLKNKIGLDLMVALRK